MQHIETVKLASAAASITFSAIPADYTDLLLTFSLRSSYGGTFRGLALAINGSTSNLSTRFLYGTGSSVSSGTLGGDVFMHDVNASTSTANTFSNVAYYFPNYTSNAAKSFSQDVTNENNATATYMMIRAGLWNQTAAITSLTLTATDSANFVQYSSASLYGITAGSDGIVTVS